MGAGWGQKLGMSTKLLLLYLATEKLYPFDKNSSPPILVIFMFFKLSNQVSIFTS